MDCILLVTDVQSPARTPRQRACKHDPSSPVLADYVAFSYKRDHWLLVSSGSRVAESKVHIILNLSYQQPEHGSQPCCTAMYV